MMAVYCVRRQNALTLILENVEESDFSDTTYNSTYVCDVQSLMLKVLGNNYSAKLLNTGLRYGIYKNTHLENFASLCDLPAHGSLVINIGYVPHIVGQSYNYRINLY